MDTSFPLSCSTINNKIWLGQSSWNRWYYMWLWVCGWWCLDDICSAEAETKAKLDKVAEIKRINAQMMGIKSEISKFEDTLKEYKLYKKFLTSVTPKVKKEAFFSRRFDYFFLFIFLSVRGLRKNCWNWRFKNYHKVGNNGNDVTRCFRSSAD